MSDGEQDIEELKAAIKALNASGSVPPSGAWELLVEWEGPAGTRALVALLNRGGQPAVHAIRMLGERGDPDGMGPLIEQLLGFDIDDRVEKLLHDEIILACQDLGATAFGPLMEAREAAAERGDWEATLRLVKAAFRTDVVDPRMSEALATQVEHHPAQARWLASEYEATAEVADRLEERAAAIAELPEGRRPDEQVVHAIVTIIEEAGGTVPEALAVQLRPSEPKKTTVAEAFITGQL